MFCAVIFLSFWAEVHYNSIYPQEGKQIDMHSINTMNSVKKHVFFFDR